MRLYNGCPDDKLKAVGDARAAAQARLKAVAPRARCVYFPGYDAHWQVWMDLKPVCGWDRKFWDLLPAIDAAIKTLTDNLSSAALDENMLVEGGNLHEVVRSAEAQTEILSANKCP